MTMYFDAFDEVQSKYYFASIGEGYKDDPSFLVQHDRFHPPFFDVVRIYEILPKAIGKGDQTSYTLIGEYREGQPVKSLRDCILFAIQDSNLPDVLKKVLGPPIPKGQDPTCSSERSWPPYGVWKT